MSEDKKEYRRLLNHDTNSNGLSTLNTAVFVVGGTAGVALLTLPYVNELAGFAGIPLLILGCGVTAYTGSLLGSCWMIISQRFEQHRYPVRDPYPFIGEVAYGHKGRLLVSLSIGFTMVGAAMMGLALASDNLKSVLAQAGVDVTVCLLMAITAAALTPFTWLNTPKDFWPLGIASGLSLALGAIIVTVNTVLDSRTRPAPSHSKISLLSFPMLFGNVCFAFGGHTIFPTLQIDMKHPHDLGKAVMIGFVGVLAMYLPVTTAAYFVYGNASDPNILNSLSPGPMVAIVQVMVLLHLFCAIVISLNPVTQDLEEHFNIDLKFNWKRCVFRFLVIAFVLFGAETIPKFGPLLALIGGSSLAIVVFICPPVFYMKLAKMNGDWEPIHISTTKLTLLYVIVIFGVIMGVMSTISAIINLTAPDTFTLPCYINPNVTIN